MTDTSRARGVGAALLIGVLAGTPLAARAQIYKCPQANGTTGYQATPCPTGAKPPARPTAAQLNAERAAAPKADRPYDDPYAGSVGSRPHPDAPAVQAPPSPWGAAPGAAPPPAPARNTSSLVADVQARNRRENQQQAYQDAHRNDKRVDMGACNTARHNLGVLNEQRPVFHYDNQGNRVFVDDKDRANTIAETQKSIAAYCP